MITALITNYLNGIFETAPQNSFWNRQFSEIRMSCQLKQHESKCITLHWLNLMEQNSRYASANKQSQHVQTEFKETLSKGTWKL